MAKRLLMADGGEQIRVPRPKAPILLFDVDDYLYTFSSAEDLEGWYEPLAEEESAACFDSLARVVTVLPAGKGWEARLAGDADEDALRAHTVAFLRRCKPDQLGLAELPLPSMVEAVAALERDVRLRDRWPWKWFRRSRNSGT
jgi:hypothetical protein